MSAVDKVCARACQAVAARGMRTPLVSAALVGCFGQHVHARLTQIVACVAG
jgi:hypothetical protein